MSHRFYCPDAIISDKASLHGAEAHHLTHVMRAKLGDEVVVFDGGGAEFDARVRHLARNHVELQIVARRSTSRELPGRLDVAAALPKGDRQEWLTQKLVELGASRLIPWRTSRSVAVASEKTTQRLQRQVIEASKQCGRNVLMEINAPVSFASVVSQPSSALKLLAHTTTDHRPLGNLTDELDGSVESGVLLGVGPEGGFTAEEIEAANDHGWRLVGLGPRTLRTETAAMALATWVMVRWSIDAT